MWQVFYQRLFEFFKLLHPQFNIHRIFELGVFRSQIQCSFTELRWDLYVKSGDNVFHTKGKQNEVGQCWCLADLLDFHLAPTGTSYTLPIDPM